MSDLNDLIEQAKGMDDPMKIVEVFKGCGLNISEAEAKAFVDTKELPDSVMDAIAGGTIIDPATGDVLIADELQPVVHAPKRTETADFLKEAFEPQDFQFHGASS